MDPLDMLLGGNPDPAAKAKALELLMRQKQLGMLGLGSGDRVLAPLGKQMIGDVQQQQEMQAQSAQRAAQQAFQQQQLQRQTAQDASLDRYRNAQLGLERQKLRNERNAPAQAIVTGEGGEQYLVDTRKPGTAAAPILGPDGKPIKKGGAEMKPLTETQGQAAMFMTQAQSQLAQAKKMGEKILPASDWGGLVESAQWKARAAGFPQLASSETLARQSILLSIAEPIVRAESGAAVPPDEIRRLALRYIPTPGESREEQHRKLSSLIAAVGGVMQKLPDWKAKEFQPFQSELTSWAQGLASGDGNVSASGSGSVQVKSVEEARALPPGTKFLDPNGVLRTR